MRWMRSGPLGQDGIQALTGKKVMIVDDGGRTTLASITTLRWKFERYPRWPVARD